MDAIDKAIRLAARQHGAVSKRQAERCGLTRDQVRHLIRSGRLTSVRRGVCTITGTPATWELRASIALLACSDEAALASSSAGYVLGLVDRPPARIDVVVPHRTGVTEAPGVSVRRVVHMDIRDVRTVKGLRVTCPARTLVDLAATQSDRALSRAVDRALLSGLTTIKVIRRYIRDRNLRRRPGVGRLVKLLEDREFGVPESELERRFLELVEEYGLPAPERQVRVGPHRVDFMYDEARIVVEVDGRATHGTSEAFEADPMRQNALVLEGWATLRFTWKQVTEDPDYVADTIRRALE